MGIITTHCEETHQKVHHSSAVVGYGLGKREADAEPGYGVSTGPRCHNKNARQCHKTPKQHSRKIPRKVCKTIVDTTYIEQCKNIVTTHCQETSQKVHHSSHVVGHDSKVVAHGSVGHAGY